jgi:single-strand DNA-binding protein
MLTLQAIGNLTADATLEQTAAGKSVCKFTVAVNNKDKSATFIRCVMWDKRGEAVAPYLLKGNTVYIEGMPKVNAYADKSGAPAASVDVTVDKLHFCGGKRDNQEAQPAKAKEAEAPAFVDSEIPF